MLFPSSGLDGSQSIGGFNPCGVQIGFIRKAIRKPFGNKNCIAASLISQQSPNPATGIHCKEPQLSVAALLTKELKHRRQLSAFKPLRLGHRHALLYCANASVSRPGPLLVPCDRQHSATMGRPGLAPGEDAAPAANNAERSRLLVHPLCPSPHRTRRASRSCSSTTAG